jgi:menaquinone-dependent protoporphyrinogen oxidase
VLWGTQTYVLWGTLRYSGWGRGNVVTRGVGHMGERVLVAYASLCGSTAEIAEEMGQVLQEAGADVRVCDVTDVLSLEGYSAVVLGTAIRLGQPVKPMKHFLRQFGPDVAALPNAVFSVGTVPRYQTPSAVCEAARYLSGVVSAVQPMSIAMFAGKIDPKTIAMPWRALVEHSEQGSRYAAGDWRDWNAIDSWARDLARLLLNCVPVGSGVAW